ncbi:hypothetical protein, partial [Agrobacterium pusense]|uniref:hypothetical protein n=1 Tax=Agrobacterium pusense TaxID=648995 RepID=UPI001AEE155C
TVSFAVSVEIRPPANLSALPGSGGLGRHGYLSEDVVSSGFYCRLTMERPDAVPGNNLFTFG